MPGTPLINPFRPGAGHPPPYLAGRDEEKREFAALLDQDPVLTNLVLTGLRGVGKTVLLETFKPIAIQKGWLWAGTDLAESATVSEESIAIRLLADLAPLVANVVVAESEIRRIGFTDELSRRVERLDFALLKRILDATPGLNSDKLKAVLEIAWGSLRATNARGIVLAYDEAQNLSDQASANQFPLSLLLDVFQSLQKKGLPFLMVLTGLPTLFPKLVDARTFAERMFHVTTLGRLDDSESRDAILKPIEATGTPIGFTDGDVVRIVKHSGGYPYFIQFLCRETFDAYLQQHASGQLSAIVPIEQIIRKLDNDFFAGRWSRVTDRQRELLLVIARLPNCDEEFTVQEIVQKSKETTRPFSPSHVNQILAKLAENSLVYKNRHGRYSFAVPLLGEFILRQESEKGR